jgi:hypothetical protein
MTHWDTLKQPPVGDKSAAAIGGFFFRTPSQQPTDG